MNKKEIKELVLASYIKGELNQEKVERFSSKLKRKDLKSYIRGLKLLEKKKQIVIAIPTASIYNTTREIFLDIFPDKIINIREDKLILLGGKVFADDMVYDFSLRKRLEDFIYNIEQTYDSY